MFQVFKSAPNSNISLYIITCILSKGNKSRSPAYTATRRFFGCWSGCLEVVKVDSSLFSGQHVKQSFLLLLLLLLFVRSVFQEEASNNNKSDSNVTSATAGGRLDSHTSQKKK